MAIDAGNVLIACAVTGYCSVKFGWSGLVGSLAGNAFYYFWLRDIFF